MVSNFLKRLKNLLITKEKSDSYLKESQNISIKLNYNFIFYNFTYFDKETCS